MSNWINHVKEYATRKGMTYNASLKDPDCKSTYHAKKTESKAVDTGNKVFRKKRETNKLLNFGEESISIPREMALDDKAVQTLTPSNTIRKRNKKPAINIEPNDENNPILRANDVVVVRRNTLARSSDFLSVLTAPFIGILTLLNILGL